MRIRQPMIKVALSAACALLAACASHTSSEWDDTAWSEGALSPSARGASTSDERTASIDTGMKYADANKDGKVTRDEAKIDPNLVAAFDDYDKNDDGVLDSKEFAQLVADSRQSHEGKPPRSIARRSTTTSEPEFARMEVGMDEVGPDDFDAWGADRARLHERNPNSSPYY